MGKYFFKHDNLARFSKMQTLIILENSSCERCIFSTSTPFHFLLSVNHQIFIFTLAKYLSSFTSFIKVHNHKFCPNFLSLSVPMFPFSLIFFDSIMIYNHPNRSSSKSSLVAALTTAATFAKVFMRNITTQNGNQLI